MVLEVGSREEELYGVGRDEHLMVISTKVWQLHGETSLLALKGSQNLSPPLSASSLVLLLSVSCYPHPLPPHEHFWLQCWLGISCTCVRH